MASPKYRITPYSLRHVMLTEALEYEADFKAVAEVMGHANPTMLPRVFGTRGSACAKRRSMPRRDRGSSRNRQYFGRGGGR